ADKKVQAAVAIVVDEGSANPKMIVLNTGLFGNVGEGAVAIVVIENRGAPIGDVEILVAIVVVVSGRDAHGEALARYARLRGHVGKRAIAIVAIEMIGGLFAVGLRVIGDAIDVPSA